jgi:hypothetical protein
MKHFLFVLFLTVCLNSFSQTPNKPVTWTVEYKSISATEGEVVFTAKIDKKWHIYSQRPTDVGPIPTSFTVSANDNVEIVGTAQEGNAHEEYVAAFDAKVFVFTENAVFKQKIKRKNASAFSLQTALEFMTCNDVQCLPPSTLNFTVEIPALKKGS